MKFFEADLYYLLLSTCSYTEGASREYKRAPKISIDLIITVL